MSVYAPRRRAHKEAAKQRRGLPRWFDVAFALVALALALPVLIVAAFAVRLSSPGPVLFRQERVGRRGRRFELVKFRSMRVNAKSLQVTSADDPLITGVGRILRRAKIDELPSFLNVVRGDMSLVGPRPEVPSLVDTNDGLWADVLAVKPGLTDPITLALRNEERLLAQVRGRAGDVRLFYRDLQRWKLRGYAEYLRRRSAWSDFLVLMQTGLTVVGVKSVNPPTMTDIEAANAPDPSPNPRQW